jgi:PAS domain S-box-containing protein
LKDRLSNLTMAGENQPASSFPGENRFAKAFRANPDPMAITRMEDGTFLEVNESFARTFGFAPHEVVGRTGIELGIWRNPADRRLLLERMRDHGPARNLEFEFGTKSGHVLIGLLSTEFLEFEGDVCMLAVMRDITDRKQMEEALIFNEQLYRELFEYSSDVVFTLDLAGNLFSLNRAGEALTGYSREEALRMNVNQWIVPGHQSRFGRAMAGLLQDRAHRTCEVEILCRSGETITLECGMSLLYNDGAAALVQNVGRNITERKRTEELLRRSEEKFFKAFHSLPVSLSITSMSDGRILDANERFVRLTGFSREEALGHTTLELGLWPRPEARREWQEQLLREGRVVDREVEIAHRSGPPRTVLLSAEMIDLHGELCVLSCGRDVTEQRLLEAQLRQAQKMEAIGRLAGGVAHDFNNLLSVIIGYSDMLYEELGPAGHLRRRVEQIRGAADRAASLTRQLLAFSRQQMLSQRVLDLNTVIREISRLVERLVGEDVRVVLELEATLGSVKADGSQLEQVIMNLAVNARDAMPHGGRLVFRTRNSDLTESPDKRYSVRPGQYVELEVTDTGCGMDGETLERIFEPFFTTKEMGKGTGLGLATVYGIVKQSGGYIWAASQPNRGASFHILLPRVEESPDSPPESPTSADLPGGSGTILLTEDEDSLRELTAEFLREAGYHVLLARDGAEAYEIAREYEGAIDLLLTDVVMPRMNGPALAEQLHHLRPATPVLFISGYSGEPYDTPHALGPGSQVLAKPFRREQLLQAVREVMQAQ